MNKLKQPGLDKSISACYISIRYVSRRYIMAKENKSKYAVLGALSNCPGSGYDIKKMMEQSTSNFWNESYGQIYPILKQLVEEGLAASHTEKQEGKPEKYIYTLTDEGQEELRHWLIEPI